MKTINIISFTVLSSGLAYAQTQVAGNPLPNDISYESKVSSKLSPDATCGGKKGYTCLTSGNGEW